MFPPGYYQSMEVEENGWSKLGAMSSRKPENKKKTTLKQIGIFFPKNPTLNKFLILFRKFFFIGINFFILTFKKNFFYTHLLEDFYIVHDHIDAFLFLLQRDFYITHKYIGAFWAFFLQKDFHTFHEPFSKAFLCFFDNILLTFLYIGKKSIFCQFFLHALKINEL